MAQALEHVKKQLADKREELQEVERRKAEAHTAIQEMRTTFRTAQQQCALLPWRSTLVPHTSCQLYSRA